MAAASPRPVGEIKYSGYLLRESVKKSVLRKEKPFQKRWVILRDGVLEIHKTNKKTDPKNAKHTIELDMTCKLIDIPNYKNNQFTFGVTDKGGETTTWFAAENEQERQAWTKHIRDILFPEESKLIVPVKVIEFLIGKSKASCDVPFILKNIDEGKLDVNAKAQRYPPIVVMTSRQQELAREQNARSLRLPTRAPLPATDASNNDSNSSATNNNTNNGNHDAEENQSYDHIEGSSLLHLAVQYKQLDLFKGLLERKAKIDIQDDKKLTPLYYICLEGLQDFLDQVLKLKVPVTEPESNGFTPIMVAVKARKWDFVKYLLQNADVDLNVATPDTRDSALHLALKGGEDVDLEAVKMMVEHMSSQAATSRNNYAHTQNRDGFTAVDLCARASLGAKNEDEANAYHEIIKSLVAQGAPVNVTDVRTSSLYLPAVIQLNDFASFQKIINFISAELAISSSNNSNSNNGGGGGGGNDKSSSTDDVDKDIFNAPSFRGYPALHLCVLENRIEMARYMLQALITNNKDNKGASAKQMDIDARVAPKKWKRRGTRKKSHFAATAAAAAAASATASGATSPRESTAPAPAPAATATATATAATGTTPSPLLLASPGQGAGTSTDALYNADHTGLTALHLATIKADKEMVQLLLEHGADVHAETPVVESPLSPDPTGGMTPLLFAVQAGSLELVELFIEHGADPHETVDCNGFNCLHYAASGGHIDIVKMLVEKCEVNVNAVSEKGQTSLSSACASGQFSCVEYLLSMMANPEGSMREEPPCLPPIHNAVRSGNIAVLDYLIKKGAKLDQIACPSSLQASEENSDGSNLFQPLHIAVMYGLDHMVRWLINNGAPRDVTIKFEDQDDVTLVHLAAMQGHENVLVELLKKGLDINAMTSKGISPLSFAIKNRQWGMVRALREFNARADQTALQLAVASGNQRAIQWLSD